MNPTFTESEYMKDPDKVLDAARTTGTAEVVDDEGMPRFTLSVLLEDILTEDQLLEALEEARCNARVLAHAYEHGSSSPEHTVRTSLAYPVKA